MAGQNAPQTLIDLLRSRVEASPDEAAFGVPHEGGYRMVSWRSFWSDVLRVATGLRNLGIDRGQPVGILSAPSLEWELAHFGCLLAGAVVVGLDPNAPASRLRDVARRADIRALITDRIDLLGEVVDEADGRCRFAVVISDGISPESGCRLVRWRELLASSDTGRTTPDPRPPSPTDGATIVFTSGTTGDQKGIPYSHAQMTRAVEAIVGAFPELGEGTRMLCWLPLSAPFQRILDLCAIRTGGKSYFVPDPELLRSALQQVRPDLLIGVPRFYEKLASGIQQQIAGQPWPARSLARLALRVGRRAALARDRRSAVRFFLRPWVAIMDRLVLRRIRDALGGRIRFLVSGSAPLGRSLVEFFHACGLPMYEAYGVSEDIVPIAMNTPKAWRIGSVGRPLVEGSVKLGEDGVVQVRDPGVFAGYLNDDTVGTPFTREGYYRTGDLGSFDEDGFLFLRGREGEIIKTSTGRRIALPKVEALLRENPFVEQALAIGAGRKCLVGLLTVDWRSLARATGEPQPEGRAVPTRLAGRVLMEGIEQCLQDLPDYERPAAFLALQEGFSIQHGELTPSFKLRRKAIERRYGTVIEELYDSIDNGSLDASPIRFLSTADLRMLEFGELPGLRRLHTSRLGRSLVILRTALRVTVRLADLRLRRIMGASAEQRRPASQVYEAIGEILRKEIGPLKGPLVKVGQALSYVAEDLPSEIRTALSSFQEVTPPLEPEAIRPIVERELGRPIPELYADWSDRPLASASISQIHLARLYDGREVVVKVKYPGIEKIVRVDLASLRLLVPLLAKQSGFGNLRECLDELGTLLLAECDFRREAENQERFRRIFLGHPDILIPGVVPELTSRDVLTMEYVDGQRFREFRDSASQEAKDRAARIIWTMTSIAVNRHGMFNGDPHPGNYLFLDDRVCFLDFGFVKRWSPEFMELQKAHALAAIERDVESFARVNVAMGYVHQDDGFDHEAMLRIFRDVVYSSWLENRKFRFTKEFVRQESTALLALQELGPYGAVHIPTELLAITRLFWGLHAVLADLEAEANWHELVVPLLYEKSTDGDLDGSTERQEPSPAITSIALPWRPLPRVHLFEFDDQPWLRGVIREAYLDVLDLAHRVFSPFRRMHSDVRRWAAATGHDVVLDLASGSGGHIATLLEAADSSGSELPRFVLSDIYPPLDRYRALQERFGHERIGFVPGPLSATLCSGREEKLWMVSTALHHFSPEAAREIVSNAVRYADGLFVMEPYQRSRVALLVELLLGPPFAMITPLVVRPFHWSKLLLSTVIPVVPALILWDGLISILRTYRREELESFIPDDLRDEFQIDHGTYRSMPGVHPNFVSIARRGPRPAGRSRGARTESPRRLGHEPTNGQDGSVEPAGAVSLKPHQP